MPDHFQMQMNAQDDEQATYLVFWLISTRYTPVQMPEISAGHLHDLACCNGSEHAGSGEQISADS